MEHIVIRSTGVYHPARQIGNEHYIRHFEQAGKNIRPLLNATGRQTRYLSDRSDENSMTMAVEACHAALDSAHLTGQNIDLLIFSSCTPEYLAPTNALQIHKQLKGRTDTVAYDMNANCVGMIVAIEQASRAMLSNRHCQRALIVGSEQMHRFSQQNDEVTLSNFGDAACAVVIEKTEKEPSGFIDSSYFTDSSHAHNMVFPETGMSRIYDQSINEDKKRIFWPGGPGDKSDVIAADLILQLLERNKLHASEIKKYFLSQVSLKNLQSIADLLKVNMENIAFIGDQYGYTGTSSPFLGLHHAIEEKSIQRGDYIVFWSIGTGLETCAMLWKF